MRAIQIERTWGEAWITPPSQGRRCSIQRLGLLDSPNHTTGPQYTTVLKCWLCWWSYRLWVGFAGPPWSEPLQSFRLKGWGRPWDDSGATWWKRSPSESGRPDIFNETNSPQMMRSGRMWQGTRMLLAVRRSAIGVFRPALQRVSCQI